MIMHHGSSSLSKSTAVPSVDQIKRQSWESGRLQIAASEAYPFAIGGGPGRNFCTSFKSIGSQRLQAKQAFSTFFVLFESSLGACN
jgi:hypothetical protein